MTDPDRRALPKQTVEESVLKVLGRSKRLTAINIAEQIGSSKRHVHTVLSRLLNDGRLQFNREHGGTVWFNAETPVAAPVRVRERAKPIAVEPTAEPTATMIAAARHANDGRSSAWIADKLRVSESEVVRYVEIARKAAS